MDHFFQIRGVGARRGADARGLDDARLHGRALDAGPARPDGRRRPLPQPGSVGQGGDHARRPVRRPGVARASARPGTRRSRAPWASRSRHSASGSRCSRTRSGSPTRCGRGERGSEAAFEGRQFTAERLLNSPAVDLAAARPDHDRRRRREEDAPPRRAVRRRVQRLRLARGDRPQVPHPRRALRRRSGAIRPRSSARRSRTCTLPPTAAVAGRRPRRRSSTASGSSSDAGAEHVIFSVPGVDDPARIAALAQVIPALQAL